MTAREVCDTIVLTVVGFIIAVTIVATALGVRLIFRAAIPAAHARDSGQWSDQPPEIRQWFQSVMQPNNSYMSCCGEADAFDVDLDGDNPDGSIATIIIDGKGMIPNGTRIDVPREKLQAKYGNPLDKYILFLGSSGQIYCLIPKVGA